MSCSYIVHIGILKAINAPVLHCFDEVHTFGLPPNVVDEVDEDEEELSVTETETCPKMQEHHK